MNILVLGDIFAKYGRKLIIDELSSIKEEYNIDFTIANGENIANGKGVTRKSTNELYEAGIDVLTGGNHIWDNKDVYDFIQEEKRLIRPANFPSPCPGRGYEVYKVNKKRIGVINLSGTTFMSPIDNPFNTFDKIYENIQKLCDIIIVDFHAEATSEKIAMGYFVEKKASIIYGTHTHVQTADERILAEHTGYITDVGMCGSLGGVIGMERDFVIKKFRSFRTSKFALGEGERQLCGCVFTIDDNSNRCIEVQRIYKIFS